MESASHVLGNTTVVVQSGIDGDTVSKRCGMTMTNEKRLIDANAFLKDILTAGIGKTIIEYSESGNFSTVKEQEGNFGTINRRKSKTRI